MKKLSIFLIFIALAVFVFNNCSDSPNLTENQDELNSLDKGKPPSDPPEITELWIDEWNSGNPQTIPNDNITVHYKVINANKVDYISISFRYDHDGDDLYRTIFDPYVFHTTISHDGSGTITGDFPWDGSVRSDFSSNGILFDQLSTEGPDQYLLSFSVSGRNLWVYNGQPAEDERVFINAGPALNGPFWVTSVEVSEEPLLAKKGGGGKGKFTAELYFRVTCSNNGESNFNFKGSGRWETSNGEFGCCPNYNFDSHGTNQAVPTNPVLVKPGTYRFYVKNLYSPDYSYDPALNSGEFLIDTETGELYAEYQVN